MTDLDQGEIMAEPRLSDEDRKYARMLESLEQASQQSYDKAVLTLSGGAIGVSFAFVSNIVSRPAVVRPAWLLVAWLSWGLSVTSVLFSFYFSHRALRHAINEVYDGTHRNEHPVGFCDRITGALNALGGVLFLFGVISIVVFAQLNMR
jgi:hypothetical protein